jgi:hypothetical protein
MLKPSCLDFIGSFPWTNEAVRETSYGIAIERQDVKPRTVVPYTRYTKGECVMDEFIL